MNAKADNVKSDAPKRSIDFDAKTKDISKPKNISSSAWEVYTWTPYSRWLRILGVHGFPRDKGKNCAIW